ncbi:MAG TPA: hypothetical protein VE987_15325 [Polyangiaceae bacterium]|nr:hypothetical protein [Polyangiaceae bacterium]
MEPKVIRSELDEGASTWLPYGISVDVSEWEKELLRRSDQLVEEYKAKRSAPIKKKK